MLDAMLALRDLIMDKLIIFYLDKASVEMSTFIENNINVSFKIHYCSQRISQVIYTIFVEIAYFPMYDMKYQAFKIYLFFDDHNTSIVCGLDDPNIFEYCSTECRNIIVKRLHKLDNRNCINA